MKTVKLFFVAIGIGLCSVLFFSCLDDDGYSIDKFWIALATVVPVEGDSYYLRLDDGTTLWPAATNRPYYKPEENQRALVNFTLLSDSLKGYDHFIKVNDINNVLTKNIAENLGEENDAVYGKDPLEIADIWTGDNYLNVYFRAYFGGVKKHFINLIPSDDENAMLELRHNAYDDPKAYRQGSLVAFNLSDLENQSEASGDSITLTVKVNTFDGDKIYKVKLAQKTKSGNNAKMMDDVFLGGYK